MERTRILEGRARKRSPVLAFGASMLVHISALGWLLSTSHLPDPGFEFALPAEVEFGLTASVAVEARPAAPSSTPAPGETAPAPNAATTPALAIAEPTKRSPRERRPRERPRRETVDAGTLGTGERATDAGTSSADGGVELALPPGAQLALRMDMAKIRESPLADDARRLLAAIPDWQLVLDGSGIDPLVDLERLLIASPNMDRSEMRLAGRYAGDESRIHAAVAAMARARGTEALWTRRGDVDVASWANVDETPRGVAILPNHEFAVTKLEYLDEFVAIARAQAARDAPANHTDGGPADAGAPDGGTESGLLAMHDGAAILLDVEGARRFVRVRDPAALDTLPERLHLAIEATSAPYVVVRVEGSYESRNTAARAAELWSGYLREVAAQPALRFLGFGRTLDSIELETNDSRIRAVLRVPLAQVRLLLGMLEGAMQDYRQRLGWTPSGPTRGAALGTGFNAPPIAVDSGSQRPGP